MSAGFGSITSSFFFGSSFFGSFFSSFFGSGFGSALAGSFCASSFGSDLRFGGGVGGSVFARGFFVSSGSGFASFLSRLSGALVTTPEAGS